MSKFSDCLIAVVVGASVLLPGRAAGQTPPPGRAHLFVLDLAGTPVGELPTTIKQTKGSLEVALKDGVPMLKASVTSEFVITLPQGQVLPPDFTLEFDLVPKLCCNPPDLSFEGTSTINQGAGSAHILWDSDGYLAIIGGGGENYEAPMWEDFRTLLPGVLTRVVAVVQGPTIRLYTNGRRHYTLDKQFARGRVLRVSLGVDLARQDPVYLAGLRIVAGAGIPTAIATNPTPTPGQPASPPGQPASPPGQPASPPSQPASPPSQPALPPGQPSSPLGAPPAATAPVVSVTTRPGWGFTLSWRPVVSASGYQVERSVPPQAFAPFGPRIDAASPLQNGFYTLDDVTVLPGVAYAYRVSASFPDGTSSNSIISNFVAPTQVPQISNLTAAVGAAAPNPSLPGIEIRSVTWSWNPLPGAFTYEIGVDSYDLDPATGQPKGLQPPIWLRRTMSAGPAPSWTSAVRAGPGWKHQFCVSVIRGWSDADPLPPPDPIPSAVCLATDVPSIATTPPPTAPSAIIATASAPTTSIALLAGPANLSTMSLGSIGSWGILLWWSPVANATGYRINRTVTGSGSAAVVVNTISMPSQWGYQPPNAVDPSVGPGVSYTYWVEALMADGSVTAPSPVSAVDALAPSYFPNPIPSNLFNLQASVSGTRPTVMPGMLAIRGAISGSEVTWTWNPLQYGLIYNVSYEIVGGLPGVGAVFERWTVPFVSDVNSNPGPVVTRAGVPQGRLVKFCMSLVPDPDPAKPLPYASCLTTQVP